MDLKKLLCEHDIEVSDYGNISVNDIFDVFVLGKKFPDRKGVNLKLPVYYMSAELCFKILNKYYKGKNLKLDNLIIFLGNYELCDLRKFSVYIISGKKRKGEYKIGKWCGTYNGLISRYNVTLLTTTVHLFEKVNNPLVIEKQTLKYFDDCRLFNSNGNKSEWIKNDLRKIRSVLRKNILKYDTHVEIEVDNKKKFNSLVKLLTNRTSSNKIPQNNASLSSVLVSPYYGCIKKIDVRDEYFNDGRLCLGKDNETIKNRIDDVLYYIYNYFTLDQPAMEKHYASISVSMDYDHNDDIKDISRFIRFRSHYVKDNSYFITFNEKFESDLIYRDIFFVYALHSQLVEKGISKIRFYDVGSISLTNTNGEYQDSRGIDSLDWKLYWWNSYTVSNNWFVKFADFVLACYKIKSHKFDTYYERYLKVSSVTNIPTKCTLYPYVVQNLFVDVDFGGCS